jgi:hypothetical protein
MSDKMPLAAKAEPAPPPLVAPPIPEPPANTLDNQAAQAALRSSPAHPTIVFDPLYPWMVSALGNADELAITWELYGFNASVPLQRTQVLSFESGALRWTTRYLVAAPMLQSPYREEYQERMRRRRAELDTELAQNVAEIKDIAFADMFTRLRGEGRVIDIVRHWATEPFPIKPSYLDRLFTAMNGVIFDTGWIVTNYTNLYSYVLDHFARADEIRKLRDEYSQMYRGEEAIPEVTFLGTFWEDVKSGAVASWIGNYFVGLGKAGVGFLKGLYTLVTDPGSVLEAIGRLPGTLKTLWQNRGQLWDQFVNASPDEQARMIGRLFGEAEIAIGTAGAGGGPEAASKAPQLARAFEVVGTSRGAAVARLGGGAIPIDLGALGPEAVRLTSLMTMTGEAATSGKAKADELAEQAKEPAGEQGPSPEEQRKAVSERLGEGPETELQVSDRPGWYAGAKEMPGRRGPRTEWYERRLSHAPDRAAAEQAGREFAADIGKDRLEYVSTSITERTPAGRAQVSAVTPPGSPAGIEFEHEFRLTRTGLRFKPDGVEASGAKKFWFLDNKAQIGIESEIARPEAVRRIEGVIETYVEVQRALADRGCRGLILIVDSPARQLAMDEILAKFPKSVRDVISVRLR